MHLYTDTPAYIHAHAYRESERKRESEIWSSHTHTHTQYKNVRIAHCAQKLVLSQVEAFLIDEWLCLSWVALETWSSDWKGLSCGDAEQNLSFASFSFESFSFDLDAHAPLANIGGGAISAPTRAYMCPPLKGPAYMRSQGASLGCREFSLGVQKGCRACAHASVCTHVLNRCRIAGIL